MNVQFNEVQLAELRKALSQVPEKIEIVAARVLNLTEIGRASCRERVFRTV